MYKVFFNDSIIQFRSGSNKSSKNNIVQDLEDESYGFVNQIVYELESGNELPDFVIQYQHVDKIWDHFRCRFVEIPAAGGLVQNSLGELLFIRRLGKWDLPKGKIEKKESPEQAAIREVEEECGLADMKIVRQLDSTFHIYRSPFLEPEKNLVLKETKWYLMSYPGNEAPVPQVDENIEEVRWFPVSEIHKVAANTYRSLNDFLDKTLPLI